MSEFKVGQEFYRFESPCVEYVYLHTNHKPTPDIYKVIKITPCGVWIVPQFVIDYDLTQKKYSGFVHMGKTKRYALPTVEEAWKSFEARKLRQMKILRAQVERCQALLDYINKA